MEDGNNSPGLSGVSEKTDISFLEIPCVTPQQKDIKDVKHAVAVIQTASVKIEITNDISDSVLTRILREAAHA